MKFIYDSGVAINIDDIKTIKIVENYNKDGIVNSWYVVICRIFKNGREEDFCLSKKYTNRNDAEDCILKTLDFLSD